ncbi:MAG TPA: hypothetical protein PLN32_09050, partial [Methanoregulaceae archaeon]|nr:hypothetical protein [Methanoregulaceae archaeon]
MPAKKRAVKTVSPTDTSPHLGEVGSIDEQSTVVAEVGYSESEGVSKKSYRRIPLTADVLVPDTKNTAQVKNFQKNQMISAQHFHFAIKDVAKLYKDLKVIRVLPSILSGKVFQFNNEPAALVQVRFDLANSYYSDITKDDGSYEIHPAKGITISDTDTITIAVYGSNSGTRTEIQGSDIAPSGLIHDIMLNTRIDPLNVSIIQRLESMQLDAPGIEPKEETREKPAAEPTISLGETDHCLTTYKTDFTVERFPYGVFFRLVEPRTSILNAVQFVKVDKEGTFNVLPLWSTISYTPQGGGGSAPQAGSASADLGVSYLDRVPIEQPISVDGFRDQIIGVDGLTTVGPSELVPMAGTLGLGYIVHMAQSWTPKGYALGNLIYSLPLAPGEQQKVAIFERTDIAVTRESELLDVEEQQRFQQLNDTSAYATFRSAFSEAARGGSHFDTRSYSESGGFDFLIFSGGGGSSGTSGNSSSWLEGVRNSTQTAAEDTHSAVVRQASARRSALRTSMRLAVAQESENVTTKVITNHNHTRALTLQFWEVQRLFETSTAVDGVTLVCLVPLEVIRFLPSGQPLLLTQKTELSDRAAVLNRYNLILRHADILARRMPREFQYGLTLLTQFAGDPTAEFQDPNSAAEDVIYIKLDGTFLPFEEIYVSAVTRRGTRLGPVRMNGPAPVIPDLNAKEEIKKSAFSTKEALLDYLRVIRNNPYGLHILFTNVPPSLNSWQAFLTLPPSLARNDIVGFEITRRFQPYTYKLVNEEVLTMVIFGMEVPVGSKVYKSTITLDPNELEKEIGGPVLTSFSAKLIPVESGITTFKEMAVVDGESYSNVSLGEMKLPASMSLPARQMAPVLHYSQVLEIEKMLQHVVRNTVTYSKAVWQSLTPEERAILLEGFTIGIPEEGISVTPDGIADASQMVPLLNCVENRILGFYGNSMMLPFSIPPSLVTAMGISTGDIQKVLIDFHRKAFSPPRHVIALPTRGVLGEAVLGSCVSAEKIDLTRFWNWADAPADIAPEIAAVTLPTTQPSLTAGLSAPNTLTGMTPLINNFNAGTATPAADTSLLQAMVSAAAQQKGFSTELTGASLLAPLMEKSQETAEKARADALKTVRDHQNLAMAIAGNIVGGIYGGNPTAGSSALSAMSGGSGEGAKKDDAATKKAEITK